MNPGARFRQRAELVAFFAVAAAVLLLLEWARRPQPAVFLLGGLVWAAAVAFVLISRRRPAVRWLWPALGLIAVGLASGAQRQRDLGRVEFSWADVAAVRERQLTDRLSELMRSLTERARLAAGLAAEAVAEADRFAALDRVLRRTGVDALMYVRGDGTLVAWAGDHRGPVPPEVLDGTREAYFAERSLYSYLYFTRRAGPPSDRVVAAVLVETGAIPTTASPGLEATFAGRTDVPAVFRSGPSRDGGAAWSLTAGADTVVHARLDPYTQVVARDEIELRTRRIALATLLLALAFACVGWRRRDGVRGRRLASTVPIGVAAMAFAVAPIGRIVRPQEAAYSLAFVLPVPGVSLGDLAILLIAAVAIGATTRARRIDARFWPFAVGAATVAVALAYPFLLALLFGSAAPSMLEKGTVLWLGLQVVLFLLLALVTALALPARRRRDVGAEPRIRAWAVAAAIGTAALLGALVGDHLLTRRSAAPELAALWAVPALLLAVGMADGRGPGHRLVRWLGSGFLAASALLPQLWGAHVASRLAAAEREIETFGAVTPATLEYMLEEFAREALRRDADGEAGLQMLYRSWVASGLAQEPYAVRITLWESDAARAELGLGGAEGSDTDSGILRDLIRRGRQADTIHVQNVPGLPNASLLLTVALDARRAVSVSVQPRRTLERAGVIAPFLGRAGDPSADVNLVPLTTAGPAPAGIQWTRTPRGWRSEVRVWYPDGWYHAHTEIRFTGRPMRLARATLLVTVDLGLLLLLWFVGHIVRGLRVVHPHALRNWLVSFRARITVALFVFFLVPTALFGWIAYGGLSALVAEAAGTVAARAARQAVVEWPTTGNLGDLRELSLHAGADVLRYVGGQLIDASSPEGLALGVYGAWMSPESYRRLASREELTARDIRRLEGQSYLSAYHFLPPSGTLGVPVALSVGDTASWQRAIADLMLLAAVLGLILSGVLSFAVGRALADPIGRLRRAATAVGAGRLSVRLPEPAAGEFGVLFASFNRMVRRLRRARAQQVRTTRVLAWGEMAQQIAHEIKNPLTPIKLAVQHLRRAYRDRRSDFGEILDDNVGQILGEIERLTQISRAFSRYGAPSQEAGPLETVDAEATILEVMTLYRAGETGVEWDVEFAPDLPSVKARPDELREVLLNLLENAREAIADGGRVRVAAHGVEAGVRITVTDDGPGIAAELIPRIFEPHFSTRSSGTGLGLAIVRRLVEGWDGEVTVESTPGEGTTFHILIPPSRDPGPGAGRPDKAAGP